MNKEFIPYEQILELKEIGFNGILWQEAFRWFREKHGLMGVVDCFFYNFSYTYNINDIADEIIISRSDPDNDFDTYEEAELACLKKLIEIIERKPEAYS